MTDIDFSDPPRSKRLTFRLLDERDKPALYRILQNPAVTEPAGFKAITTAYEFERFWRTHTDKKSCLAILLEDMCIGYYNIYRYKTDLEKYRYSNNAEIAFLIGEDYQRNGYAAETLATLDKYLLTMYDTVWADYFIGNTASERTIEKCGFRFVEEYDMFFEELGEEKKVASNVLENEV